MSSSTTQRVSRPAILQTADGHTDEAPAHARLILTDEGDVLGPDDYDVALTREVRRTLGKKKAWAKYIRWLRPFLRYELHPGEPTYAFLTESDEDAVARCKGFFKSIGLTVEVNDDHLDGGYEVSHPTSIRYLRTAVTVVRQLYTRLCGGLRPSPANPMNVNGWHLMTAAERLDWAVAHQFDTKTTLKHAGGRFTILGIKSSPPAIEDPSACGPQMTQALIDADVPETVLDVAMVMEANGSRNASPLNGNALGWAKAGLGDEFWSIKKFGGDELVLLLVMPSQVHRNVVRRMEALAHPKRKGKTMMDYIRELAALDTPASESALSRIALFPSSLGGAYSYSGFYYWFDDAIDGNVLIRTANASRKPTSHWYRHAAISEDVRVLFERTTVKREREDGLQEIMDDYGLSSDQTKQYAAFEYLRDGRRRQRARGAPTRQRRPSQGRLAGARRNRAAHPAWRSESVRRAADEDAVVRVPIGQVHPDDRAGTIVGDEVELDSLAGRTVRMTVMAVMAQLGVAHGTLRRMVALGIVERGDRIPAPRGARRWWLLLDPAATKRSLYDAFTGAMSVPRSHGDFERYLQARETCDIPAAELPPPAVVEGMVLRLLELGSTNPVEIAAFTPHHPANEAELQRLATTGAARALGRRDVPTGARPTRAMVLDEAPGLANAPGTAFDKLLGEDLSLPKDDALRTAWALGPMRHAALLWAHLAAGAGRPAVQVRTAMRHAALMDAELSARGRSADDADAVGAALEALAFGEDWAHLKPAARVTAARSLQLMARQLHVYARRNDPTGARGIAAMVPAQHPDRLAFAGRLGEAFAGLWKTGGEARKLRADRAADRYAEILDIAALRTETMVATQVRAGLAAAELTRMLAARAAADAAHRPRAPDDVGNNFVEFVVPTTVMTPKGRLLAGSQNCRWRAWRERDLWLDMAQGKTVTRQSDRRLFKRLREIADDPEAYCGIVFEWRGCQPEHGDTAIEPWFVTISNRGVLAAPSTMTPRQRRLRHSLIVEWKLPAYARSVAGLLNFDRPRNILWCAAADRGRHVVPIPEFAFAMRFAQLGLNTVDETLCRISEFLQMRQDSATWKTSGETGSEEVSFLSIPKSGRHDRKNGPVPFQVEQVTFVEAAGLAVEVARHGGDADGVLPEVAAQQSLVEKYPEPQAWIFQFGGQAIDCWSMNRFLRFLLGNVVDVTYHELRHAASNASRQAGIPEETIQRLMHHRHVEQTRWYFRSTRAQRLRQQVVRARKVKARSATRRSAAIRRKEVSA